MGAFLSRITGTPHLYDMHSSLVQQMENFRFSKSGFIKSFFRWTERISLGNAKSVIVICRALFEYASKITGKDKITIIENFIDDSLGTPDAGKLNKIKKSIKNPGKVIVTYAGTLETYQGIPMLLDSISKLPEHFRLILIGGKPGQIAELKSRAKEMGLGERVIFTGRLAPEEIPYYLEISDVLVSPRILGTNIPLKIYSFLKSGKPLVATNLYTHSQTLTAEISILTDPDPQSFADGIKKASGSEGKKISKNAKKFCEKNYSILKYDSLVNEALKKAVQKKRGEQ